MTGSRHEETVTLAPDIVFQRAANSAAAAAATAPPFLSYRVATDVSAPSMGQHRRVVRAVAVRTKDDLAVLQDLPSGENQLGHGFPVTPAFDALSYFTLSWKVGAHGALSAYVHDVVPLTYDTTKTSGADVVVVRLYAYRAEYATDSSDAPDGKTHINLVPYDFVKKHAVKPQSTFYLSDVVVDNATHLPTHVRYLGGDGIEFAVDYTTEQGHWVVSHAHYEETLHGPLAIGRLHVIADAVYDQFAFPPGAPDPRLVPAAGPSGIVPPVPPANGPLATPGATASPGAAATPTAASTGPTRP
ncbi:MAG: hypothetical protein NVS3B17_11020 [Vulcanimicrobiaceae bacterium]